MKEEKEKPQGAVAGVMILACAGVMIYYCIKLLFI